LSELENVIPDCEAQPEYQLRVAIGTFEDLLTHHMHPSPIIERILMFLQSMFSSLMVLDVNVPVDVTSYDFFLVDVDRPRRNARPVKVSSFPCSLGLIVAGLVDEWPYRMGSRGSVGSLEVAKEVMRRVGRGRVGQVEIMSVCLPVESSNILEVVRTEDRIIFHGKRFRRMLSM
jgi:hypothetical protein